MWETLCSVCDDLIGGDAPHDPMRLTQTAVRAAVVYVLSLALVRYGKSRFISQASAIDVLIVLILGSLLSRGITGSASISTTMVASGVLVLFHFSLTWLACHSHRLGSLIKGNPRVLVEQGAIDWPQMGRSHISQNDLIEALRLRAGTDDLSQIKVAYKERNGAISFILYPSPPRVVDLAVHHGVQTVRIELT
ncbi:MAG TPA: YetF domain-containing protein [Pirellulales bacterium]|nr:YetF domain-containing protein [Pirellulales bacterium]